MWQDYVGIAPGVAAAIMGAVTLKSKDLSRWKRRLVYLLTIIAIGGTGFSGWWTIHEKRTHDARQTEILESLGKFIDEGQRLQTGLVASPATPVQEAAIADWMQRTANYLNGMGTSYVIRFMSNAGLETALRPSGLDQSHINYWDALRMRLVRLHGFSAEISGQRQSDATSSGYGS